MSRSWMSHVLPVALGGGVSPTVSGRWGSPRLPQQRSTLPFQLTRCFPNYEQGLKRQQKKKKEAQTYSRKGLPGGSRRRTRRGPRPEMVTAASRRLRISPPPPPPQFWHPTLCLGCTQRCRTVFPPPRTPPKWSSSWVLWQTPPHPKTSRPSASQLPLLSRSGTNSPVLK